MHNECYNMQIAGRIGKPHTTDDHLAEITQNGVNFLRLLAPVSDNNRNCADAFVHVHFLSASLPVAGGIAGGEKNPLRFATRIIQLINSASLHLHSWRFTKKGLIPEESNL